MVRISSTLFKKATAAEIFLNKLDERKKKLEVGKTQPLKNIIKVGEGELEVTQKKETLFQNLISEPGSVLPQKGRRKSIEVLMKDQNTSGVTSELQRPTFDISSFAKKSKKEKLDLLKSKHKKVVKDYKE